MGLLRAAGKNPKAPKTRDLSDPGRASVHPCIRDLGATLVVQFADGSAMKLPRCCIDADGASQCAGHGGVDGGREPADSRRNALAAATERREYPSLGGQELGERTWAAPWGDRRDAMFWEVSALRRARARTGSGVLPRTFAASPPQQTPSVPYRVQHAHYGDRNVSMEMRHRGVECSVAREGPEGRLSVERAAGGLIQTGAGGR